MRPSYTLCTKTPPSGCCRPIVLPMAAVNLQHIFGWACVKSSSKVLYTWWSSSFCTHRHIPLSAYYANAVSALIAPDGDEVGMDCTRASALWWWMTGRAAYMENTPPSKNHSDCYTELYSSSFSRFITSQLEKCKLVYDRLLISCLLRAYMEWVYHITEGVITG